MHFWGTFLDENAFNGICKHWGNFNEQRETSKKMSTLWSLAILT